MILNSLSQLPLQQLKRAIGIREQIENLTRELNQLLEAPAFVSTHGRNRFKPHGLTEAGRARIAAAQRQRWARYNAGKTNSGPKARSKKNRLSAEGRARVAAAVTARWERFRAAKARALLASA